jgi:alpha-ribazole phosphatase
MCFAVWRHPTPRNAAGLCIGRTDLAVDRRKAKRLAHRVRHWARLHHMPRVVLTSPLRRAADVGRWLARWGWTHRIDARLSELDFGAWDGQPWDAIGAAAADTWCAEFVRHAPGGGESVGQLLQRCDSFLREAPCCVVGHAGWISAALWLDVQGRAPEAPTAALWPAAVRCASLTLLRPRG